MKLHLPDRIQGLSPYRPGRAEEEVRRRYGLERIVKLASNENPLGPSPRAVEAVGRALARQHRYPVPDGWELRVALAEREELEPDHVVLGNGSAELIETLALTFLGPEDDAVLADGGFIIFRTAVQRVNGNVRGVPLKDLTHDLPAMAAAVGPRTRLLYVANPNNPTGTWVGRGALERLLDAVPEDVLVVWDEAYKEYQEDEDYPRGVDHLKAGRENLVVLGTFSKAHGLAGLRIGYALCHPRVAAELHRVRSPFNTNRAAQTAALAALEDEEHVARSVAHNRNERARLADALEAAGFGVAPSACNFLLVDTGLPCEEVFEACCRRGVILRPMTPYGFPTSLRISVGLGEENDLLLEALPASCEEIADASETRNSKG